MRQSSARKLAVVAVGGNSLIVDDEHIAIPCQSKAAAETAHYIADIVQAGWDVVVTHGNGPQVGFILRRVELGIHEVPPIPMNYATSNTQGSIGYMFQRSLRNEFRRRRVDREVATLVSETLVDRADPAFDDPVKPIGPHLDEATARQRAAEQGWVVKEDAGRGWRRVVPSPRPEAILELGLIRQLLAEGTIVVACGGGGIPVFENEAGDLQGIEAVIDKDLVSSLLAQQLGADLLLISTAVERVAIHFNQPQQQWLDRMTLSEARRYHAEGHFLAGSMGPKIRSMIDFIAATGGNGIITDPTHLVSALAGEAGTWVVPDPAQASRSSAAAGELGAQG
ncbi:MAG: carbamate kinase [Acidobacteriota bacterium]